MKSAGPDTPRDTRDPRSALAAWYLRDLHRALWTLPLWSALLLFLGLMLLRDTFDNPDQRLAESRKAVLALAPKSVPDAENAALLYRRAEAAKVAFKGDSELIFSSNEPDYRPSQAVRDYLKANNTTIADLLQASKMKECNWGLAYLSGVGMAMPHLAQMRDSARLLALRARVCAQDGDHPAAAEALAAIYRMARHTESDPSLITGLVSVAMSDIATSMIESITLWDTPTSATDLQTYRDALRVEGHPDERLAQLLKGEKVLGVYTLDLTVHGGISPATRSMNIPWYGAERRNYLAVMDQMIERTESGGTKAGQDEADFLDLLRGVQRGPAMLTCILAPSGSRAVAVYRRQHDSASAADMGLAIHLYRLKYGRDPDALGKLVPEFLQAVPCDHFNGQPFRMRKDPAGIRVSVQQERPLLRGLLRIYACGENGVDDEGHNTWTSEVLPEKYQSKADDPVFRVPPLSGSPTKAVEEDK